MRQGLIGELQKLPPTGRGSFEHLIADLLSQLTGRRYFIARAGRQAGLDAVSDASSASRTGIECKRYLESTDLRDRELLGELMQAHRTPDLDLWVLVASRTVHAQLINELVDAGRELGLEVLTISAGDDTLSSLEVLCASQPAIVLKYLGGSDASRTAEIETQLEVIRNAPGFEEALNWLRTELSPAYIGYDHWRAAQNQQFLAACSAEQASFASFGQTLAVGSPGVRLIARKQAWVELDAWFARWGQTQDFFALVGGEGDGKSWAVASWLIHKMKVSAPFPAIVFLASSRVASFEPLELLRHAMKNASGARDGEYWGKRLHSWMQRTPEDTPALILILDGINERHTFEKWRDLLQQLAMEPWRSRVAVMITCRTSYWKQHLGATTILPIHNFELAPYNDDELAEALEKHGLRAADLPTSLLPLVRKPRYLDLVVRHRERMAESGDVTVARLIYEDWRDRAARKNGILLTDAEFQQLIRELSAQHLEGRKGISHGELRSLLPRIEDADTNISELTTDGTLRMIGGRLKVHERLLPYGLGLVLADEVKASCESGDCQPAETIARWLEPHSGLDIKAAICEAAVVHALQVPDYPEVGQVALLGAWVNTQNPTPSIEESFPAYLPLSPLAFVELAEVCWSDSTENAWAQELIMAGLLRWRRSARVKDTLVPAFERWLGYVHPGEPRRNNQSTDDSVSPRAKMAAALGFDDLPGTLRFGDYELDVVDQDGLLRLGRVALAVISHESRAPYARAMAAGCLAEALMKFPEKGDLFAWVLRTSPQRVWPEVEHEALSFIKQGSEQALLAARRLLRYEGSAEAAALAAALPQPAGPRHPLQELHENDPCGSGFTWRREDCARCAQRTDLESQWLARQLKQCCMDPDLVVPADMGERLAPLAETIPVEALWAHLAMTSEQHLLEEIEPALAAFAPEALADLIRRAARHAQTRTGLALRQAVIRLQNYTLLLGPVEIAALEQVWRQLTAGSNEWTDIERIAESFLFAILLPHYPPEDQWVHLIARPEQAHDLLAFEPCFRPLNNSDDLLAAIVGANDETSLQRLLWFVMRATPSALSAIAGSICQFLTHDNSLIRSLVLQILHHSKEPEALSQVVRRGWAWDSEFHQNENQWGSLILCEHGQDLSWEEIRCRVHPNWLGYALQCRGTTLAEACEYGNDLRHIWDGMLSSGPDLPADLPRAELDSVDIEDPREIVRLALSPSQFAKTVTFVGRTSYWGGRLSSDYSQLGEFGKVDYGEQQRSLIGAMQKVIEAQRQAGNELFARYFRTNGLTSVIADCYEKIEEIVVAALEDTVEAKRMIARGRSLYEGLCSKLLVEKPSVGLQLHHKLRDDVGAIRYQKPGTRITWVDYGLFAATPTLPLMRAWERRLAECTTDRALLEVTIAAHAGTAGDWIRSRINRDLKAEALWKRARALMLLGLSDDPQAADHFRLFLSANGSPWLAHVAEESLHLWKRNRWARHWFQSFLFEEDQTRGWASFRLFLECVDSRYYHWGDAVVNDLVRSDATHSRLMFLRQQWGEIEKRSEKNEKELAKSFLTEKVLDNSAWPWMANV